MKTLRILIMAFILSLGVQLGANAQFQTKKEIAKEEYILPTPFSNNFSSWPKLIVDVTVFNETDTVYGIFYRNYEYQRIIDFKGFSLDTIELRIFMNGLNEVYPHVLAKEGFTYNLQLNGKQLYMSMDKGDKSLRVIHYDGNISKGYFLIAPPTMLKLYQFLSKY